MAEIKKYVYLECSNEQVHKFYELSLLDKTVIAVYGRIETKGTTRVYGFDTIQEAESFFVKQLQQKLRKGYEPAIRGNRFFRPVYINPKQLQIPFITHTLNTDN